MKKALIAGGVVIAALAVLAFVLFGGDAPDEVDIDVASEQLDADLAAEGVTADFDGDINGQWVINNEVGEFNFETASGSFAGFRVDEELTIGEVVVVGRTAGVTGSITIDTDQLTAAAITVDMTTLASNDSRRDNAMRGAVGAASNPEATFVLTEPVTIPDGLADNQTVTVDATGDLTINGVTNTATFAISAVVRDDGFGVVTGSSEIVFADYDVIAPSAPIVVSVDEEGIVEFQLIVAKN